MQGITQGSRCPTWTVHGPGNFRSSRPLSFYLVLDEICLFLNYAYAGIQRMQRGGSGPRGSLGNEGVLTQPPPSYACGHAGSHRIQESRRFPVGNADRQPRRGTIAEPLSVVPLYPEPQSSTRNFQRLSSTSTRSADRDEIAGNSSSVWHADIQSMPIPLLCHSMRAHNPYDGDSSGSGWRPQHDVPRRIACF